MSLSEMSSRAIQAWREAMQLCEQRIAALEEYNGLLEQRVAQLEAEAVARPTVRALDVNECMIFNSIYRYN